jgi:4,5-DOPA dioxygenase extradiol
MNAIQNNAYTQQWSLLGERMQRPKAILSVCAHWFTQGTRIHRGAENRTIYDMYGFPDALYRVKYDAPGAPEVAGQAAELLHVKTLSDDTWGLDHGTWSVLRHIYPKADIPVFQVSVDADATMETRLQIGQDLRALRDEGVMIFCSGNVVHNLSRVAWDMMGGFDWADEFDAYVKQSILRRDFGDAVDYRKAGVCAQRAVPTEDHYAPLIYALGATDGDDRVSVFNDVRTMGSLSMTGYLFESYPA